MTSIVGVYCTDGIVVATDSATTSAVPVGQGSLSSIEQPAQKIWVHNTQPVIGAGTGAVGLGQRFWELAEHCWNDNSFQQLSTQDMGKNVCATALNDFRQTGLHPAHNNPMNPSFGALVGYVSGQDHNLCEFEMRTLQPEWKSADTLWYCSMGSAQFITDTFLALMRSVYWQDGPPNLQEGIFAATWTLLHAIDVNPGGVNGPPQIATISRNEQGVFEAKQLDDNEVDYHKLYVTDAIDYLRDFRTRLRNSGEDIQIPQP